MKNPNSGFAPGQRGRQGGQAAGASRSELLEAERRAHGRARSLRAPRRRCGDVRNLSARNAAPWRRGAAERYGRGAGSGETALPAPPGRMGKKRGTGLGRSLQRQRGSERRGASSWVGAGVRRWAEGAGIHGVTAVSVSAAARQPCARLHEKRCDPTAGPGCSAAFTSLVPKPCSGWRLPAAPLWQAGGAQRRAD